MPDHVVDVRIVEVGPRDGLQNEATPIPTEAKLEFIRALKEAGLQEIEATSFVSPKWIPQLGDAADLWPQLPEGPSYSALVPNLKGLERAIELGVSRIALFTAASDDFTKKNINMTVEESLVVFQDVATAFREAGGQWIRGYISTAFECPYAGRIDPRRVEWVAHELIKMGCDEIVPSDTIGTAAPPEVRAVSGVLTEVDKSRVAWHFHDTHGTAIANVDAALELGYRAFDASAAGLGGCPYAKGAGGNIATDDLAYFMERMGLETGLDRLALASASLPILKALGRPPAAKAQVATLAER